MKVEFELNVSDGCRRMIGRALGLGKKAPTREQIAEWVYELVGNEIEKLIERDSERAS